MALPSRATVGDIETICRYLLSKPTGATLAEAKAVLEPGVLDHRKIAGYKFWNMIDDSANGKMCLSERGHGIARDSDRIRNCQALNELSHIILLLFC